MEHSEINYSEWTARFSTQQACLEEIARHRWPTGFRCPRCGHGQSYYLSRKQKYQCAKCRYQGSVTSGTLFHRTHVPLPKWFGAIYWMSVERGEISALELSKLIGVSWTTAHRLMHRLRRARKEQDRSCWLFGVVEVDDTLVDRLLSGNHDPKCGQLLWLAAAG